MDKTTYLIQNGSFLSGFSRSIDLFGNYTEYNRSESPEDADLLGLRRDFEAIGGDLWEAFHTIGRQQARNKENVG